MNISVVLPVYDEQSSIRGCLERLAAQTRAADEVIVVDNNCTDDTITIVGEFGDRLPITVVTERRQGVAWARRTGFDAATCDVIARLDADTRAHVDWLDVVERYLSSTPDVSAVNGASYTLDIPFEDRFRRSVTDRAAQYGPTRGIIGQRRLTGGNMAIRRDAWSAVRGSEVIAPGTHEDLDLALALTTAGHEIGFAPAMIVGLSPRRYFGSIRETWRYLTAIPATYRAHGRVREARLITAFLPVNMTVYLLSIALIRPYDPATGRWRPFRTRHDGRVSPVA